MPLRVHRLVEWPFHRRDRQPPAAEPAVLHVSAAGTCATKAHFFLPTVTIIMIGNRQISGTSAGERLVSSHALPPWYFMYPSFFFFTFFTMSRVHCAP